jgi:hypothetical protein
VYGLQSRSLGISFICGFTFYRNACPASMHSKLLR